MPGGTPLEPDAEVNVLRHLEWAEISALADRIRTAVARGRPDRATAAYMGFWIGRFRWWVMPRRQQRGIVATVAKVAASSR